MTDSFRCDSGVTHDELRERRLCDEADISGEYTQSRSIEMGSVVREGDGRDLEMGEGVIDGDVNSASIRGSARGECGVGDGEVWNSGAVCWKLCEVEE